MFSTVKAATGRVARLLTRALMPSATRPITNSPLGVEWLEAREVPATFRWLGGLSGNQAPVPANWTQSTAAPWVRSTTLPPSTADLRFDGGVSSLPAFGLSGSAYNSISLVNGYSGQVQTSASLTYHHFTLAAPAAYNPQADQTVDQSVNWTQGSLGGNGTTFRMTGGTATITPGAGKTLQSGMGLRFENAVQSTISTGTLQFLTTRTIVVKGTSTLSVAQAYILSSPNADAITLPAGDNQKFIANHAYSDMGLYVAGGQAHIEGGGIVQFTGKVATAPVADTAVYVSAGALVIENGTVLDVGADKRVQVSGGKLATKPINAAVQPPATIAAKYLSVSGGEVVISDGTYTPGIVGHRYGVLEVQGQVGWTGGTYKPTVGAAQGGVFADRWEATDTFVIGGPAGVNFPTVAPISNGAVLNFPYEIMSTGDVFKKEFMDTPLPSLFGNWGWDGADYGQNSWSIKLLPD